MATADQLAKTTGDDCPSSADAVLSFLVLYHPSGARDALQEAAGRPQARSLRPRQPPEGQPPADTP